MNYNTKNQKCNNCGAGRDNFKPNKNCKVVCSRCGEENIELTKSLKDMLDDAENKILNREFKEAKEKYEEILEIYPGFYKALWGKILSIEEESPEEDVEFLIDKFSNNVPLDEIGQYKNQIDDILNRHKQKEYEEKNNNRIKKLKKCIKILSIVLIICFLTFIILKGVNYIQDPNNGVWEVETLETVETVTVSRKIYGMKVETKELPAITSNEYKQKVLKEATCTEEGLIKYTYNLDGYEISFNTSVQVLGHNYSNYIVLNNPSETETGLIERTCLNDKNHKETKTIPVITSNEYKQKVLKEATCTEEGLIKYIYNIDGYEISFDASVQPLGHNYSNYIVLNKPTETETGLIERTCLNDKNHKETKAIPVITADKYSNEVLKEATCEEEGLIKYTYLIEDEEIIFNLSIKALNHNYSSWETIIKPSEKEKGIIERKCLNDCTHKESFDIPNLTSEEYIKEEIFKATCDNKGLIKYSYRLDEEIIQFNVEIDALGHDYSEWNIVKPATETENGLKEKICNRCNEKVEEEIIFKLYTIRWYWNNECIYINKYDSQTGLLPEEMYKVEKKGYLFQGWYKSTEFIAGTKVDEIEKGTVGDLNLYLKMILLEYSIEYVDAYKHSNPLTYTINDEIMLKDASSPGMKFSRWIDENGNTINKIDKGTTGNIKLYACYFNLDNDIISYNNNKAIETIYDEEYNNYYFLYQIGEIDNIVLSEIEIFNKTTNQAKQWLQNYEQGFNEIVSENVSNTVSKIVTETEDWKKVLTNVETYSKGLELSNKIFITNKFSLFMPLNMLEIGVDRITNNILTTDFYINNYEGTSSSQGIDFTISSAISYDKSYSKYFEMSNYLTSDAPNGIYKYVTTGKVLVYMFVLYDTENSNYYISIYNVLKNDISTTILYEASNTLNIDDKDELSYDIPFDYLDAYLENSFLVNYDANGGKGQMDTTLFSKGEEKKLPKNTFKKEGYFFSGWSTSKDGEVIYYNGSQVKDITTPGNIITLYAKWIKESNSILTITFDPCSGEGIMENQIISYYEYQNLPINKFKHIGYSFKGWSKNPNGEIVYEDGEEIYFKNKTSETITLYAVWEVNTYKISFNTGTYGSNIDDVYYQFGTVTNEPDTPTANLCVLTGWKFYNANNYQEINFKFGDKMLEYNIIASAQWLQIESWIELIRVIRVTDDDKVYDSINTKLNVKKLLEHGYTEINVTLHFYLEKIDHGYQDIWVYKEIGNTMFHSHTFAAEYGVETEAYYKFTLNLDDLLANDNGFATFVVEFGANGNGDDDWDLKNTTYWIVAK